ncbi:WD-40 repeat protein [Scheffersomyces xylosifermentans]|uniref:WD-40 repeat protein n=1 Tax=Scheffersomyces xylosifermentans TaxID=1304137 RepID=UPI00315DCFE7
MTTPGSPTVQPIAPTKKGFSYVLGDSTNSENHILPINASQYSAYSHQLFTAGRDGTIKVWDTDKKEQLEAQQASYGATKFSGRPGNEGDDYDSYYAEEYQDLDEKILKLETSISSNPLSYTWNKDSESENGNIDTTSSIRDGISKYSIGQNYNVHFDWINDIKLINNDHDLVSCSSDLSIKLINLDGFEQDSSSPSNNNNFTSNNSSGIHKFPNVHTDYIKKISYVQSTNHLISGGLDGKVIVWDLFGLKPLTDFDNRSSSMELPSSIYSLANSENLVSTGGPNNTINIFDKRSQKPFIRRLIGHQDNIRCLLMNDQFILSGSSDTTIKLWDLRNFKVYKNFDLHDYPVWSLENEGNDFQRFYSGDRGGNIVKTDLSFLSYNVQSEDQFHGYETFTTNDNLLIDEKLGISTVVAKESSPILSLCWEGGENTIFSSNYESLNRYMNPDTTQLSKYQYLRTCLDYSINRENQINDDIASGLAPEDSANAGSSDQNDLNSDFYDLISHLSMDTNINNFDLQSTFSAHNHNLFDSGTPPTDMLVDNDRETRESDNEEYNSMFLNVNGGPSKEFINTFKEDFEPPPESVHLQKPFKISEDILDHDERYIDETPVEILLNPIPAEQISIIPFNLKPVSEIKITPKSIISKRTFNNKRQLLVLYINGDIKIWDLLICKEIKTFPQSASSKLSMSNSKDLDLRLKEMDDIFQTYMTQDTLNNWCEVEIKAGKLLVTIKESSYLNVEVYYDDLVRSYPFLALDHPDNKAIPKNNVKVTDDDRFQVGAIFLLSIFHQYALYEWEFDAQIREELRLLKMNRRNLNGTPIDDPVETGSVSSSIRRLKYFGKKPSRTSLANLSQQPSPAASTNTSVRDLNVSENPVAEFLNFNEESISNTLTSTGVNYENSLMRLLQTNKKIYWDRYNHPGYNASKAKVVESVLKVDYIDPTVDENFSQEAIYTPLIPAKRFPSDLLIIIFEHSPDLGNYRDLCSFKLSDISNIDPKGGGSSLINDLRLNLPRWIGHPVLYNRYPHKEVPKIAFQLLECDYGSLPPDKKIGGKVQKKIKKLPVVESSIKLTSHNMLRVSKILYYLTEKFDSKTAEMKDKKLTPPDWLVLECKGEELTKEMTLQTIKTKIWKSSSDIELRFRRKFDI